MPTSSTDLRRRYGFARPYDFAVALPFLLNAVMLALVLAAAGYFAAKGFLGFGTQRFIFFAYLAVVTVAGAVLAVRPRISLVLVMLAFVELSLGLTTSFLSKAGIGFSALPRDVAPDLRFVYHPLLQGVPAPGVTIDGEWGKVHHNATGQRGADVDPTRKLVYVYGGSSTYDVGLAEGDTWVERLNEELGSAYQVVNLGVPGYSTAEHIIQTAFYDEIEGARPVCSLYYVGWNEARNAYIPGLDPGYADFHLLAQVADLETRQVLRFGGFSSLYIVLSRTLAGLYDTVAQPKDIRAVEPGQGPDPRLEHVYERNLATLSAINRGRGVPTLFVAQIMNPPQLTSEGRYGWFPLVRDKDVWPLVDRLNGVLKAKAAALGDGFVDAGVTSFGDGDFIDQGHFNPGGARKFARLIAPEVRRACRLDAN
jgi:hypothetical protein